MYEEEYEEDPIGSKVDAWTSAIRTLANAYEEREPTEYVVDKFFSTGSLNIVYGAPAVMKSMVIADLCACVVSGQEWLPGSNPNGQGVPVTPYPVLWLDLDNGKKRTDERFDAIGKARNIPADAPFHYLTMPNPIFSANDEIDVAALIKIARDYLGAKMIVIDNLGLITGDVEENSAKMAQIMGYLRVLAERTEAAVIVIHHQRKGGAGGSRAGDALRGHSSIEAAIDLALQITREQGSNEIMIRSTKTRGVDVPTVGAYFNFDHRPNTNDLEKAWFSGTAPRRGKNAIRDAIIDIVDNYGEIGKMKLVGLVAEELEPESPGVNKIRSWIADMIAVTGELTEEKKGNYRVISLP